ncbi:sulfotransferase domain-containing protein [Dapis sp. BLCC M172]|uniref:sulfotransferase family protein n=1 Tax=Dapis sp. BLCC M172 TaxID=2975281 RepID=UPI003CF59A37
MANIKFEVLKMGASDFRQGNQFLRSNKFEEAVTAYRRAIARNPNFHWSYHRLGEALEQLGRLEETVAAYRQAVQLKPDSVWPYFHLGRVLRILGRGEEARKVERKIVEVQRNSVKMRSLSEPSVDSRIRYNEAKTEIRLPNFIIIGAMKGGTTSLYHYLASHPEIVPSTPKETNFFRETKLYNKGLKWYQSLFKKGGKYFFEASPNYTKRHYFSDIPARMYSILPEVKLIYVLRDPIQRLLSHYVYNYFKGRESGPFSKVIKDINSNYIQTSKYYFQIQAFLEYYSDQQLLVVESEQLFKNPAMVVSNIFNFLGIRLEYNPAILEKRFNDSRDNKCNGKLIEKPSLSPTEMSILTATIAPDVEKLRNFTGLKFSDWSL